MLVTVPNGVDVVTSVLYSATQVGMQSVRLPQRQAESRPDGVHSRKILGSIRL